MPVEWFGDNAIQVAYQAVPNERITYQGIEVSIAPPHDLRLGIGDIEVIFGGDLVGSRVPKPENPG
jgi:hypothetical protein